MKKIIIITFLFSILSCSSLNYEELDKMEIIPLFALAEEKYKESQYEDAIFIYEYIMDTYKTDNSMEYYFEALYNIGIINEMKKGKKKGLEYYQRIVQESQEYNSGQNFALLATKRIKNIMDPEKVKTTDTIEEDEIDGGFGY